MKNSEETKTIDQYINSSQTEAKKILTKLRNLVNQVAPDATETIKYGMPTFVLQGNLVHFAAQKKHIGFYPAPSGVEKFKELSKEYVTSKGAIQFPYDKPIPYDLIREIVKFRMKENNELWKMKDN